jgi:Spy/CpxP family protein refolding chaperone
MKNWVIVAMVIMALMITTTVVVTAARNGQMQQQPQYGMGPRMGQGMGMMHEMFAKQLNLTQDQMRQLKALHEEFRTETQATKDQLKTEIKDMIDLWAAPQPDAAVIKAKAAEIDALKTQMRDTGIDYAIKGLNMLTPAQREKLRTIIREKGAQWMEKGMMCWGCCMGMTDCCPQGMGAGMGRGTSPCPMMK